MPPLLVRTNSIDRRLETGAEYHIGRDPTADIVLTDTRVSGRHATLRADEQSWVLEDQGSSNGIYVDGQRAYRVDISPNQVVRLGDPDNGPELRFELQMSPAATEPELRPAEPGVSGLPSVDRPITRIPLPPSVLRIGRAPDNDRVISDLSVSRYHAVLRKADGGQYEIVDRDSYNGTFVNGIRVQRAEIGEVDIIGIGHATFQLADGALREHIDTGDVSLQARDLSVERDGKTLLDHVSLPVEGRSLVAVIGMSGAGKSTLLNALSGMRPADTGTVLYGDRDLYQDIDELRHRIGFVPQDDIVHTQLTPHAALGYAAELRFPGDASKDERSGRVDEVLAQLGLTHRADARWGELSGGQRKRVNVALELLTKPSLLFLDEPTSGLDPGLDAQFMEQMRDLAHAEEGRTIILVTHSVENLHTCDRVLVLINGGKVAYFGPPRDALTYFGQERWADVFRAFEEQHDRDYAGEFRQSREYARYVVSPMIADPHPASAPRPEQHGYERKVPAPSPHRGWVRQLSTLTRRYLQVIWADPGYRNLIVAAPLVLGGLVRLAAAGSNVPAKGSMIFSGGSTIFSGAETVLITLMITVCLLAR